MGSSKLIPVILSGGAGTRLWPVSRQSRPKPFMRMPDGQTLAEKTLNRALRLGDGEVLTVTGSDHYFITRDTYERSGADAGQLHFLLEPIGRNTAPAIAMSAHQVRHRWGGDAAMLVMPADHLIADVEAFAAAVAKARALAQRGYLVTFGIEPTRPETGYGYIRRGQAIDELGFAVERFVEKPDLDTARAYLEAGGYWWNGGIFCFTADHLLDALAEHAPELAAGAEAVWRQTEIGDHAVTLPQQQFAQMPAISIDYALMEKSDRTAVVPCDIGWNDVGSWKTISELTAPAADGNRLVGEVATVDVTDSYIQSQDRLIAAVGVSRLLIVDAGDAVLVADIDRSQEVKEIVAELKSRSHPTAEQHPQEFQPWGSAILISRENGALVRRLELRSGADYEESDQSARTWTVLAGQVKTAGRNLGPGEILNSPAGETAALSCVQAAVLLETVFD